MKLQRWKKGKGGERRKRKREVNSREGRWVGRCRRTKVGRGGVWEGSQVVCCWWHSLTGPHPRRLAVPLCSVLHLINRKHTASECLFKMASAVFIFYRELEAGRLNISQKSQWTQTLFDWKPQGFSLETGQERCKGHYWPGWGKTCRSQEVIGGEVWMFMQWSTFYNKVQY